MPNKLTDTEVKKALEYCIEATDCIDCNVNQECDGRTVLRYALDLINRLEGENEKNENIIRIADKTIATLNAENESLKAEVERLEDFATAKCKDCAGCTSRKCDCANIEAQAKAEAYKEAFEKVKEELKNIARIDWQGGYYYFNR